MIAWIILPLAFIGLLISLYFSFAYYGRVRKSRWIPAILCAHEASSCVTVVQTPYACIFRVPNSVLGVIYYLAVIAWAFLSGHFGVSAWGWALPLWHVLFWLLISASAVTVVLGFYLTYVLRRALRIDCPLCYTAHAINLVVFILLCLMAW